MVVHICNMPFMEIQENTVSNKMVGVTVFFGITIAVCNKIRIPCLMIKNKRFIKKRRMGYSLQELLIIMSERKHCIEARKDELIKGINPEKAPYFRNFLNNFS